MGFCTLRGWITAEERGGGCWLGRKSCCRGSAPIACCVPFENSIRINAVGAFLCCKECVPAMVARGRGTILFTGATAGIKAGARSVAFGPGNFAKRGLAQSLARDLGPRGIHVAWINVDGAIDVPNRKIPELGKDDMLSPDAIAETYWHLAHQDRSAWTMELEVRPFKEKF